MKGPKGTEVQMKGTEMQILKIMRELGGRMPSQIEVNRGVKPSGLKPATIARKMGVQASMVESVCEILAEDGYLAHLKDNTFALRNKGIRATSRQVSSGPVGVLRGG